jgi:hypothetical protein
MNSSDFGRSSFGFPSDFEFRPSDFPPPSPRTINASAPGALRKKGKDFSVGKDFSCNPARSLVKGCSSYLLTIPVGIFAGLLSELDSADWVIK